MLDMCAFCADRLCEFVLCRALSRVERGDEEAGVSVDGNLNESATQKVSTRTRAAEASREGAGGYEWDHIRASTSAALKLHARAVIGARVQSRLRRARPLDGSGGVSGGM